MQTERIEIAKYMIIRIKAKGFLMLKKEGKKVL